MFFDIIFFICASILLVNGTLFARSLWADKKDAKGWALYFKEREISDRTYDDLINANSKIKELEDKLKRYESEN